MNVGRAPKEGSECVLPALLAAVGAAHWDMHMCTLSVMWPVGDLFLRHSLCGPGWPRTHGFPPQCV